MGLFSCVCFLDSSGSVYYMRLFNHDIHESWMLIGDFNEIMYPSEIWGGIFLQCRVRKFIDMIATCILMDIGSIGNPSHGIVIFRVAGILLKNLIGFWLLLNDGYIFKRPIWKIWAGCTLIITPLSLDVVAFFAILVTGLSGLKFFGQLILCIFLWYLVFGVKEEIMLLLDWDMLGRIWFYLINRPSRIFLGESDSLKPSWMGSNVS